MAAIAMAMLSVGAAGAAVVSFMLTRAQDAQGRAMGQTELLAWSDSAVRTFALTHGRLPCPASTQNGVEDCSLGIANFAKGWLPVASLLPARPVGDPRERDPLVNAGIRYLVYSGALARNSESDLLAKTTLFKPRIDKWDPTDNDWASLTNYQVPVVPIAMGEEGLTMDLCGKLLKLNNGWKKYQKNVVVNGVVTGTVTRVDRWNISEDAARPFPQTPLIADEMAYGVAVAAQGAPAEASSINANFNDHRLESPLRPVDAQYQDRVKITRPAELFNAFRCSGAIASLDTMAVMHGWSGVNEGNRVGSIDFGNQFIALTELALAADSIGLAVQGVDAGIAVYNGAFNAAKLAEAAANFYVEFPFIPIHITGMAMAVAGGVQTAINLAFSAAAISMDAIYLAGYTHFRQLQRDTTVWTGGLPMLQQAHQLGISPVMVPNPVKPVLPPPEIPGDIGAPR